MLIEKSILTTATNIKINLTLTTAQNSYVSTVLPELPNFKAMKRNSGTLFSSDSQSHMTLCNPMDCSMSGFPVHHHLPKLAQTHVHRIHDTIQPSHPLSSPSPPAFNLSQRQGLFQ